MAAVADKNHRGTKPKSGTVQRAIPLYSANPGLALYKGAQDRQCSGLRVDHVTASSSSTSVKSRVNGWCSNQCLLDGQQCVGHLEPASQTMGHSGPPRCLSPDPGCDSIYSTVLSKLFVGSNGCFATNVRIHARARSFCSTGIMVRGYLAVPLGAFHLTSSVDYGSLLSSPRPHPHARKPSHPLTWGLQHRGA